VHKLKTAKKFGDRPDILHILRCGRFGRVLAFRAALLLPTFELPRNSRRRRHLTQTVHALNDTVGDLRAMMSNTSAQVTCLPPKTRAGAVKKRLSKPTTVPAERTDVSCRDPLGHFPPKFGLPASATIVRDG
jgi:hypothetical protein